MSKQVLDGKEYDLSNSAERFAYWDAFAKHKLVGRKIVEAKYQEDDDWGHALAVYLDDGTAFFVSGDDEGNHAGALSFADGDMLPQLR